MALANTGDSLLGLGLARTLAPPHGTNAGIGADADLL